MANLLRRICVAACAIAFATGAEARDPYRLDVTVNFGTSGQSGSFGYSSIGDAIDGLDFAALAREFGYTGTEGVNADAQLRGLLAQLSFGSNSGDLFFRIADPADPTNPDRSLDSHSFTPRNVNDPIEAQRRDTLEQLKDYLKRSAVMKRLFAAYTRYSPIEPLAGNPDSLFSRRQRADFSYGFTNKVSQIWGCGTSAFNFTNDAPIQVAINGSASDIFREAQARAAELQAQNEIGLGLGYASTTASGYKTMALEAPISYTAKFDSDPRKKFHVDFPLSYVDTEGAKTYSVGLGLAYTHPLTDDWSLTPAIGAGATASNDLGSGGGVESFSLTSAYTWRLGGMALSLGNGIGRYQSLAIKIGDVEADADVKNTVFTNGLMLSGPNSLIARNWVIEYSITDTRIRGDQVYTDTYDEIGIALGHISTEMGIIDSYTKIGLNYLVASGAMDDINSLRLVLSSRF